MKEFAKASKASYGFNTTGNLDKRTARANASAPEGFLINPNLSTRDISVLTNKDENRSIIAHRGTDLSGSSKFKDLQADLSLLFGGKPDLFDKRLKRTVLVAKKLREQNPESVIDLTGHSLGGSSSAYALSKSKYLRDNVNMLQTFNAGSSPLDSHKLKENESQVIHNVVEGDPISENLKGQSSNVNIVAGKKDMPKISDRIVGAITSIAGTNPIFNEVFQGSMRLKRAIANNHSLDNFID